MQVVIIQRFFWASLKKKKTETGVIYFQELDSFCQLMGLDLDVFMRISWLADSSTV